MNVLMLLMKSDKLFEREGNVKLACHVGNPASEPARRFSAYGWIAFPLPNGFLMAPLYQELFLGVVDS
jgi:hypothetical protein